MRTALFLILSAVLMSTAAFPSGREMQTCTVSPSVWTGLSGEAFVAKDGTLSPIMQDVFEKSGIIPVLKPQIPQRRVNNMHEYGDIDIVMLSLNYNEELVASSIPVFDIKATLAVRADLMTPPKTVAISDLTVEFNPEIRNILDPIYDVSVYSDKRSLRMLRDGALDAVLVGSTLFWDETEVDLNGLKVKRLDHPEIPPFPISFTFTKVSPCLSTLEEFNKHFGTALKNGLQALAKMELQQNVRQTIIGMMY